MMIARLHPPLSSCEGLTALETAVVLFITAIVAVPLLATAGRVVALPVEWQANVEAARDAREVLRQVADDARQASSFSSECDRDASGPEDDPEEPSKCWTFTWDDYTAKCSLIVRYSHGEDDAVEREETISGITENETAGTCTILEGSQLSEDAKTIGSVEHFEVDVTPIPNRGIRKCLIVAEVRPSMPVQQEIQKIAAMMRPDNARCE